MSVYRHRARLAFLPDEAEYLMKVLGPEIERELPKCRVRWQSGKEGGTLLIEAEELGALRAALNSYIRWTYLALNVRKDTRASR